MKAADNRLCPLFLHTDAAQAIGKIQVDVEELRVDYLTIVGHKVFGKNVFKFLLNESKFYAVSISFMDQE